MLAYEYLTFISLVFGHIREERVLGWLISSSCPSSKQRFPTTTALLIDLRTCFLKSKILHTLELS